MVAAVLQIEGLTVEDMLDLGKTKPNVLKHLPDECEWDHMDRKWLADILFTVNKMSFERMVREGVKARKERLEDKNGLNVQMRPEFAQAFQNCMSFSSKITITLIKIFSGEWSSPSPYENLIKEEKYTRRA